MYNEEDEREEESAFSNLFKDEELGKSEEKSKEDSGASEDSNKPDVNKIIKQNEELANKINEQAEQIASLQAGGKTLGKLKDFFSPDETAKKQALERERLMKMDENPLAATEEIVNGRVSELEEKLLRVEAVTQAERVMAQVDKNYEVDWAKHGSKIADELSTMEDGYKKSNPKEAMIKAMRLAGVGKKRSKPVPYVEGSGGYSGQMKQERMTAEKRLKDNLRTLSKKSQEDPWTKMISALG